MKIALENQIKNFTEATQWKLPISGGLFDLIAQHWTTSEILRFTLISKQFNKLVGNSNTFKTKVQLRIVDLQNVQLSNRQRRNNFDLILRDSQRIYKNFRIKADKIGNEELAVMFRNDWTSVMLQVTEFESTSYFIKYLSLLTPSLMRLQLSVSNIKKVDHQLKLNFPELSAFSVSECASSALEPFAKDEKNYTLSKLTLSAIRQSSNGMKLSKILHCFAESFEGLDHLDIGASVAESLFSCDISELANFKLSELRIDAPSGNRICDNIEKFISAQSSLVEVCLLSWNRTGTLYTIWNGMNQLEIWQMSSTQKNLKFPQCLQTFKKKKLKYLFLNFPNCAMPTGYLKPFLREQDLESIDINFGSYEADIETALETAAKKVTVNDINLFNVVVQDKNQPEKELSAFSISDSDDESAQLEEVETVELIDSD